MKQQKWIHESLALLFTKKKKKKHMLHSLMLTLNDGQRSCIVKRYSWHPAASTNVGIGLIPTHPTIYYPSIYSMHSDKYKSNYII